MNKRFEYGRAFPINSDDSLPCITDRQDGKDYVRMSDLVDLLNDQQSTIKHLEEEMGELENDLLNPKREKMDNYYQIPKNCGSCTFLGNNGVCGYCKFTLKCYDSEDDLTEYGSLPSCPFRNHQEYDTMVMNWDSLVEKTSEISLRNIELVEENARLQKKIDYLCEIFDYGSDESIQKVKEYELKNEKI